MAATNVKVTVKTKRAGAGCCPPRSTEVYRLLLPGGSRLEQLRAHIAQTVSAGDDDDGGGGGGGGATVLTTGSLAFIDDDGDAVELRSDADLQAALATLPPRRPDGGGEPCLRLQLERTATPRPGLPPARGFCGGGGGGGPCCMLKGLFGLVFVYHAVLWCCPCMFAIIVAVSIAKLAGFCCRARCQPQAGGVPGCAGRTKQPPPPPPQQQQQAWWCPLTGVHRWPPARRHGSMLHAFVATPAPTAAVAAETAGRMEAARRLAQLWDIELPEAAAAIQLAEADSGDPAVRDLVSAALGRDTTTQDTTTTTAQAAAVSATTGAHGSTSKTAPAPAAAPAAAAPRGVMEADLAQHEAAAAELRRQIELLARLDAAALPAEVAAAAGAATAGAATTEDAAAADPADAAGDLQSFVRLDLDCSPPPPAAAAAAEPPPPTTSPAAATAAAAAAAPPPVSPTAGGGTKLDKLAMLTETMGFAEPAAAAALAAAGGDVRLAIQKLIAVGEQ